MDKRAKAIPAVWELLITKWLTSLLAGGASKQTARLRRAHVAKFARASSKNFEELKAGDVAEYLAAQSWSRETRRAGVASLKSFFKFVGAERLLEGLPRVKPSVPAPRPTPSDIYELALESAAPRERLMMRLAAELGLRRGEISRVNVADIGEDLLGAALIVHGKGNKIRTVPLSDGLARELKNRAGAGGWVFPGNDNGHLSADRVGKLIAAGLPGRWTAHTLRHRFATRAYSASDDLLAVSRLLGHASVATTQRYVATDAARLRKVCELAA